MQKQGLESSIVLLGAPDSAPVQESRFLIVCQIPIDLGRNFREDSIREREMYARKFLARRVVEQCFALDSAALNAAGAFRVSCGTPIDVTWAHSELASPKVKLLIERTASGSLLCHLRLFGEAEAIHGIALQRIALSSTSCNFGGARFWFRCPVVNRGVACNRRVRVLFLPFGERLFGCRGCHDLSYLSVKTHDNRVSKLARNHDAICEALQSDTSSLRLRGIKALNLIRASLNRRGLSSQ